MRVSFTPIAGAFLLTLLLWAATSGTAQAQTTMTAGDYQIYNAKGEAVSLADVIDAMGAADAVFVGELHNDALAHAVELELLQGAFTRYGGESVEKGKRRPVALSLEMFERDVQMVLDEYLAGLVQERHFLRASRPWDNYQTDYRPLVEFARTHKLPVLAANAPERYVNRVSRLGRDALKELSGQARSGWLAPLPYGDASAPYAEKFRGVMGGMPAAAMQNSPHGALHLLDAQTLRDATMGHSIAEYLGRQPGALVINVNGNFHSEGRLGAPEHLLAYRPRARVLVVSVAGAEAPEKVDIEALKKLGDFVVYKKRTANRTF
ncbi:MAG: ChaN family lipoprotein [Pyrinomonadaceae bacterium]